MTLDDIVSINYFVLSMQCFLPVVVVKDLKEFSHILRLKEENSSPFIQGSQSTGQKCGQQPIEGPHF